MLAFYKKEQRSLKEECTQLKDLLRQKNRKSLPDHNCPKLLQKLANPVTPKFWTSSPNNSLEENLNNSIYNISNISTISMVEDSSFKIPKKEVNKNKDESEEIKRLQQVIKDNIDVKNSIWKIMKSLEDNVKEKNNKIDDLVNTKVRSDEVIRRLRDELGEKVNEIRNLKNQINVISRVLPASTNKELRR